MYYVHHLWILFWNQPFLLHLAILHVGKEDFANDAKKNLISVHKILFMYEDWNFLEMLAYSLLYNIFFYTCYNSLWKP